MGVRVCTRVQGSEKWGQESVWGQRSWNCKEKFAWESRVPRMEAKSHAGVKGSWNYKQKSAWELKGFKIIAGSPHKIPMS
jgi:hypothetical protein